MGTYLADKVAKISLDSYLLQPNTAKPNKKGEWTLFASIVQDLNSNLKTVALGTGSKCIGKSKMSKTGDILNDSHAEMMARRGFIRYLYNQVKIMYKTGKSDIFYNLDSENKCILKENIKFHLFISHTPCGDASIFPKENIKRKHESDDSDVANKVLKTESDCKDSSICDDIFRTGAKCVPGSSIQDPKLPGTNYHNILAVRTKPGRGDPTLSLSCSDKIAKWCVLGIQGALLTLLIHTPIYLNTIVIANNSPYSENALSRALSRTPSSLKLPSVFQFHLPVLLRSSLSFTHGEQDGSPCPASMVWSDVPDTPLQVAVEGRRQGITKKALGTPAAQLKICKQALLREFISTTKCKQLFEDKELNGMPYKQIKHLALNYQEAWNLIKSNVFPEWPEKPMEFVQFNVNGEILM